MSDVKIRHIIQVKEKKGRKGPIFFGQDCGCKIQSGACVWADRDDIPIRCSKHNIQMHNWARTKKFKIKWEKLFTKQYRRWRFVKMLTITLPGYLHWQIRPGEDHEDYIVALRNDILVKFRKLIRCKYWKDTVDGGQWFFECPISEGKMNPHFHIMLVGPKLINQDKLQKELERLSLGSEKEENEVRTIAKFSSPKTKNGTIQKMTYWKDRQLRPNKSAIKKAIYYALKYVRKEEQASGKNNSFFGELYKK
jgi:hypothetical protein